MYHYMRPRRSTEIAYRILTDNGKDAFTDAITDAHRPISEISFVRAGDIVSVVDSNGALTFSVVRHVVRNDRLLPERVITANHCAFHVVAVANHAELQKVGSLRRGVVWRVTESGEQRV